MAADHNASDNHVSAMLAEATRLHHAAIAELHSPHSNPLPRLRKALELLESASILAEDSASYIDNPSMLDAIKLLHQQQGQIQTMIIQLEAGGALPLSAHWFLICAVLVLTALAIIL
ncbi:MAG: hypothetical protein EAZ66_06680 [Alphaproteobacteria bacterium]|nr:MAG: hypothetical protein EAZ66_06680 [Alphaproteobacteria bacterium]